MVDVGGRDADDFEKLGHKIKAFLSDIEEILFTGSMLNSPSATDNAEVKT